MIVRSVLRQIGLGAPGRHGEKDRNLFYCPLVRRWIGWVTEIEIRGNRGCYDEDDFQQLQMKKVADDFNEAAKSGGWRLPQQLAEAISLCGFCEAYCLGEENGPTEIPPMNEIDRKKLLRDLYPSD